MPERKRILVLAYHYADITRAAGLRMSRFLESLSRKAYDIHLITAGERNGSHQVGDGLTVHTVSHNEIARTRINRTGDLIKPPHDRPGPDYNQSMAQAFSQAARKLLSEVRPDTIFVSGPPFHLFLLGIALSQEQEIPLVVELRDAWYTGMYWPYRNRGEWQAAEYWEARSLEAASKVIVVTEGVKKLLSEQYGAEISDKIEVVRHGYVPVTHERRQDDIFRIVYTGQFRGIDVVTTPSWKKAVKDVGQAFARTLWGAQFCEQLQLEYMSPHFLLEAVGGGARRVSKFSRKCRVIFAGQQFEQIDRWSRQFGIGEMVEQRGTLPPDQAERLACQADVLVLSLYGIKACVHHWCVPSKLYSYLATGNTILGLLPPGETRDIIERAGVGYAVRPDDVAEIEGAIAQLYSNWLTNEPLSRPDWEYIGQFAIDRQIEKFIECFNSF